jgi:hypothetical protein
VSDIVELTLKLAGAQDTVTHYNVTRQTGLIEDAKRERDDARTAIHDAFHGKDALIADLLAAVEDLLEWHDHGIRAEGYSDREMARENKRVYDALRAVVAKARGEVSCE